MPSRFYSPLGVRFFCDTAKKQKDSGQEIKMIKYLAISFKTKVRTTTARGTQIKIRLLMFYNF